MSKFGSEFKELSSEGSVCRVPVEDVDVLGVLLCTIIVPVVDIGWFVVGSVEARLDCFINDVTIVLCEWSSRLGTQDEVCPSCCSWFVVVDIWTDDTSTFSC